MDFGNITDYDNRWLEHAAEEEEKAAPYLQELGDVIVADLTVSDLSTLLQLNVDTHPNRMTVKRLYEQYVGSTDWAPQRELIPKTDNGL